MSNKAFGLRRASIVAVLTSFISVVVTGWVESGQPPRPTPSIGIKAGDVKIHRLKPLQSKTSVPVQPMNVTHGVSIDPARRVACTAWISDIGVVADLHIRITFRDPFGTEFHSDEFADQNTQLLAVSWADARYTGNYTCNAVLSISGDPYFQQANFTVEYSDHHFLISTFIPENNVPVWPWDLTYGGDFRGFSSGEASSRTREAGRFHHPRIVGNGFFEGPFAAAGLTTEYQRSTSVDGAGFLTADAVADWTWGGDKKLRWAIAPMGPSCEMSEESDRSEELHCYAAISDPLFDWGAFNSVDYDFRIRLEWTEPPDSDFPDGRPPRYTFGGCHDGYPNYEVYIEGTWVYDFDHEANGQTIFSMAPPCEWNPVRVGTVGF